MTPKQRLLAALRGEDTDRLPWSPFLAYWWEHQPPAFQAQGQIAFLQSLGADTLLRGFLTPIEATLDPAADIHTHNFSADGLQWTVQETPHGTLRTGSRYSPDGNTHFVVDHPVKTAADYRSLRYLVNAMQLTPNFDAVQAQIDAVGEDGLCVPQISPFGKTPFQALLEHYVGTEQFVYHLQDIPEEVEETLAVMNALCRQAAEMAAKSPAQAFISWEDSSTTNVSPRLFQRYIAPQISQWGVLLHDADKLMIHHACGHLRALLPIMAVEAVDAIESISPPPTGDVELWEAREIIGPRQCLIGGIEPVHFLTLDDKAFDAYVHTLIERMPRRGFILANSDSCPPGVPLERFRRITDIVSQLA